MKICKDCHQLKNKSEYYGVQNDCKECCKARVKSQKERFGLERICLECGKKFKALSSEIKRRSGGGKTCSRDCFYKRLRKILDEKFKYKTTYATVHKWVYKINGKATVCEKCRTKNAKTYEWSNKSGLYKQDLKDWWQLCKRCHHKYDKVSEKVWITRRKRKE